MQSHRSAVLAFATLAASLALTGCESDFVTVAPEVSTTAKSLGTAEGSGCGHILFGTATYNILAIGWMGRTQRAWEEALACHQGATALRGVTLQESWYWWIIGSAKTINLTGDAVVEKP
jgi:hypothetical protein